MGLIKSANVPVSASPFSMADIEKAAKGILLRARQQADQLLAAAQVEGEQIKLAAKAIGVSEGRSEGLIQGTEQGRLAGEAQALSENKLQLQQAILAMHQAAATLNASRADLESSALQEVVKLSISIARRITKRQGLIDPQVLIANLEEAMKRVIQQSRSPHCASSRATPDAGSIVAKTGIEMACPEACGDRRG